MTWKIPLFKTYSDNADVEAVSNIVRRGTFWANGPEIEEFEKKISEYLGKKFALAFNSGTSALHSLLLAHDIKGFEVIVPSFTFIATANAVVLAGGIPVFAECERETFGLDFEDVKKRITKKTKAILPIHYGGCVCRNIELLAGLCREKGLLLIEDAAESLGASRFQKKAGTFGASAMFSLCQNKIISSGEGGFIVTDLEVVYEKLKLLRSHGRFETKDSDYFSSVGDNDYVQLGYNYRLPTICAALALSQFGKMDKLIKERQRAASFLNNALSGINKIIVPLHPKGFFHVYQMYTIILKDKITRDALQLFLKEKEIMTKVYFNPVHLKTFYTSNFGCRLGQLPFTESLSDRVLTLPLYPGLTNSELDLIVSSIHDFFKSNSDGDRNEK